MTGEPKSYEDRYQPHIGGAVTGLIGGVGMLMLFMAAKGVAAAGFPLVGGGLALLAIIVGVIGLLLTAYLVIWPMVRYFVDLHRYKRGGSA